MKIDDRTVEDIEAKIVDLAASYTPEWHFDREKPDAGSAIGHLFALQMKENIDLENHMLDKYHTEFINMLDLSLKPAKPAGSMVKFDLVENTIAGTHIRKGTRLIASEVNGDSGPVIFETDRELYVTNSRMVDAFMTDRETGTFVPLLGEYRPVSLIEGEEEDTGSDETAFEDNAGAEQGTEPESGALMQPLHRIRPFVLFSETGNIARSALVLYHENLFDIEDEPIYIRITGGDELISGISEKRYRFKYYTKNGYLEFDSVKLLEDGETIELKKHEKNRHFVIAGKSYAVVILEADKPVTHDEEVTEITLSSSGHERDAEYVSTGSEDLNVKSFAPFTDTLTLYNECYIGHDLYFSKAGAKITVRFHTEYRDRGLYLTKQEEEAALKIIKRKPKVQAADIPADAYVDEIGLEYYNGLGWKKLYCDEDITMLFSKPEAGDYVFSFTCPKDWREIQTGAYSGRSIRMRLMKSDNCFLRPGLHHYPVISRLKIDFSYEGHFVDPEKLFRVAGTEKTELTDVMKSGKGFLAMSQGSYGDDALYLGFNARMESGPVNLYFELDDVLNMNSLKCTYEYYSHNGFRRMRVVDNTRDFSRSGSVSFMPPSDMCEHSLEGKRRFWIRIRRSRAEDEDDNSIFLPKIRRIMLNVVTVSNVVTGIEENYYISDTTPNQRFSLQGEHILDAEVWVNERDSITKEEIDHYVEEKPEEIRLEYDMLGSVSAVYVKWRETPSFINGSDRRSYMIDRVTGEIVFSDGVKADIPRVTDDISFKVRPRSSDGAAGNVSVGAINTTAAIEMYIERVYNPVRAYGGSNLETTAEALKRGGNLIYGRNRLVSLSDYIYTILEFSDSIDKAACIPGETVDGKGRPADISFVLLMKDFDEGSFSFHRIAAPLKKHLLESSAMTISSEHIFVVEPVFVNISVNIWAEVSDMDESFETQSLISQTLYDYFNPVSTQDDNGWEIGMIPKKSQILMRLGALKSHAIIKNMSIVVHYVDRDGEHEMDLDELQVSPFMVGRSGTHQVNIIYKE